MGAGSKFIGIGAACATAVLTVAAGIGGSASAATTFAPGAPCQVVSAAQLTSILGRGAPQATRQGHDCAWTFADGTILRSEFVPTTAGTPVPDVGVTGVRVTPEPGFAPGAFLEVHAHATYLAYERASGGWMELAIDRHSPLELLSVARIVHRHAP